MMPNISYDSIVATIALVIALIALIKSFSFDRSDVKITYATYTLYDDRPLQIDFGIMNNSTNSLTIRSITLKDANGLVLKPSGFDPDSINQGASIYEAVRISQFDYESPIEPGNILAPFEKSSSRYYTSSFANPVTITITTNRCIRYFSKSKSFTVEFEQDY